MRICQGGGGKIKNKCFDNVLEKKDEFANNESLNIFLGVV